MPKPLLLYSDIAEQYGGVDPTNDNAVSQFMWETLPKLPPDQKEMILDDLLQREAALQG